MILRTSRPPKSKPFTPSPESSPCPSAVFTDCEADDEDAMSAEEYISSRPVSMAPSFDAVGPHCPRAPTLQEILANTAAPPWTLGAFTAYLSQNLCLENLEFTKDAQRYQETYDRIALQMAGMPLTPEAEECEELRRLWKSLMDAYVVPGAPKEVNLPGNVRDALLSRPYNTVLPASDQLDAAIKKIYDLMDDSIMMSFVNDCSPARTSPSADEPRSQRSEDRLRLRFSVDAARRRSRSRRKTSPSRSTDVTSHHYPCGPILKHASTGRSSRGKTPLGSHDGYGSTGSGDVSLTDDSTSLSTSREPVTPPTTPPSADLDAGGSPRNRGDNNGWRKMIGRFGPKRKS